MEITVKVDKLWFYDKITPTQAEVAELADALGSGLSGLTLVRVQVPPSAHFPPKTRFSEKTGFFY